MKEARKVCPNTDTAERESNLKDHCLFCLENIRLWTFTCLSCHTKYNFYNSDDFQVKTSLSWHFCFNDTGY
jgi:hypothetical protein